MENNQQIPEEEGGVPKEEIKQVTKNPKRVEVGKKCAAVRKAKQESIINILHKKTPDDEPITVIVHKTQSNLAYLISGIGSTVGAFLGWKLFWPSSTVNDKKSITLTVNAVNPHYMD